MANFLWIDTESAGDVINIDAITNIYRWRSQTHIYVAGKDSGIAVNIPIDELMSAIASMGNQYVRIKEHQEEQK